MVEKDNQMNQQERMKRWRNVMCPDSDPDKEIQTIDAMEDDMVDMPALIERIRALISRIDPMSHYKAFENVDFLLDAIGNKDYERSPAVDVLWRHGQIDEQRRHEVKQYIDGLAVWLTGASLEDARNKYHDNLTVIDRIYRNLGEIDEHKRWLVMCLGKTLKEHVYTPWDFIEETDNTSFIRAVYEAILHRPPSPDDLKFRLEELQNGKDRKVFFEEIFNAGEHQMSHLHRLAYRLKRND